MKMKKSALSLFLAFAMVLSFCVIPSTVLSAETYEDYFLIYDAEDLYEFAEKTKEDNELNGLLMSDIDLKGSSSSQWTPIGTFENPYRGIFNGNGYTIKGLYIDASSTENRAMFSVVSGTSKQNAVIKNLTVTDSYINGYSAASIVAYANGRVTVSDCSSSAEIKGNGGNVGGIVAYATTNVEIARCLFSGTASSADTSKSYMGGIVGTTNGTGIKIYDCGFTGDLSGSQVLMGGIAGSNIGKIFNSYSNGKLEATSSLSVKLAGAGGIAGKNTGAIENCYSASSFGSTAMVGGLAVFSTKTFISAGGKLISSYFTGADEPAYEFVLISGDSNGIGVIDSDKDTLSAYDEDELNNGTSLLDALTEGAGSNYTEWKVSSSTNGGYPYLAFYSIVPVVPTIPVTHTVTLPTGEGFVVKTSDKTEVNDGAAFKFTLSVKDGYTGTPVVKVNGTELKGKLNSGVYTYEISNIKNDITITVSGISAVTPSTPDYFTVTLPTGSAFTIDTSVSTTVKKGDDFAFSLTVKPGYNGAPVVKANGVALKSTYAGGKYNYEIKNIQSDVTVEVAGLSAVVNTYTVTLPSGEGYKVASSQSLTVNKGDSFTFTVTVESGYTGTPIVKVNNKNLVGSFSGGKYTYVISNIQENKTVTVTGIDKIVTGDYKVTLPSDAGYTISSSQSVYVNKGDNFTFSLTVNKNYAGTPVVKANGNKITGTYSGGKYTYVISDIKEDKNVTVTGIYKVGQSDYTVTLPTGTGYTANALTDVNVNKGDSFRFTVTVDPAYATSVPAVSASGYTVALISVSGNVYTYEISNIRSNVAVKVSGISKIYYYVNLPSNVPGYSVYTSQSTTVAHGSDFTFTVTSSNYNTPIVMSNGSILVPTYNNGRTYTYVIEDVTENKNVSVNGYSNAKYTVTLPKDEGYKITYGASNYVASGSSFTFSLTLDPQYSKTAPVVKANNVRIYPVKVNGRVYTYTIANITSDIAVSVSGLKKDVYNITLLSGNGYLATPQSPTTVDYNGSFTFTVSIYPNFGSAAPVVKANGTTLNYSEKYGTTYTYVLKNITSDTTISVLKNEYTVTLPTGQGYKATPTNGSVSPVVGGGSYSFTVTVDSAYLSSTPVVTANGKTLYPDYSIGNVFSYTITGIKEDINVAVSGLKINTFNLTLPKGNGYNAASTGNMSVIYGGTFSFTVTVDGTYSGTPVVKANNRVLTASSVKGNVYTYNITYVRDNQTVTVSGLTKNTYTVTLPTGTGYKATAASGSVSPVTAGGSFSFKVTPDSAYSSSNLTVKVNGKTLTAVNGVYTIKNITENQVVTVTGIKHNALTITATAGTGGTISPTGSALLEVGGVAVYVIKASSGYAIKDVMVDGKSVGKVEYYIFNSIDENHTISASFEKLPEIPTCDD